MSEDLLSEAPRSEVPRSEALLSNSTSLLGSGLEKDR
jgi:hypothetical protein